MQVTKNQVVIFRVCVLRYPSVVLKIIHTLIEYGDYLLVMLDLLSDDISSCANNKKPSESN